MCFIPIPREQCDRVGEASVPIAACVMRRIFNRVAGQHGMTRRFGKRVDLPFPPPRGLQVSRRIRRDPEKRRTPSCWTCTWTRTIALDALRNGVRSAPFLHHEALSISTVVTMTGTIVAQLIVEGATKRVVLDVPEHEKISYSFSESHWCTESTCQELIEWLGAWVRKQRFLHWVLL